MKPEPARSLAIARRHLSDAKSVLRLPLFHIAAREAYLAAFHAVEAYVLHRTGRIAKTHGGLRAVFARLVKDEPRIDPGFVRFLAKAYDLKALTDYGTDPALEVSSEDAESTIEAAERLIATIGALLEGDER